MMTPDMLEVSKANYNYPSCLPVQVRRFLASCFLNHSHYFFFEKSEHSNVSDRGVFHTSLSKGKCGYDGRNIGKEIIVSAWNLVGG